MWVKNTNASVSDILCAGPEEMKGKRLNDMTSLHDECISTGCVCLCLCKREISKFSWNNRYPARVLIHTPKSQYCCFTDIHSHFYLTHLPDAFIQSDLQFRKDTTEQLIGLGPRSRVQKWRVGMLAFALMTSNP